MARVDDTASLAGAEAGISRDAARRLDVVFRSGAGIFSILVLLIAWEAFARSGKVTAFMLPPFSAVAERIYADAITGELWRNLGVTMFRALTGFVIAAVGGVALGTMMVRNRFVRWFFDPIISVGFPMPKIAFLPIIILWLGLYDVSKISVVVFDAIFPVVTATLAGLAGVERELIWSGRNMGASRKFRNLAANNIVALVIDDIASRDPWRVRCLEIRGTAEQAESGQPELKIVVFVAFQSGQCVSRPTLWLRTQSQAGVVGWKLGLQRCAT